MWYKFGAEAYDKCRRKGEAGEAERGARPWSVSDMESHIYIDLAERTRTWRATHSVGYGRESPDRSVPPQKGQSTLAAA